MLQSLRIQMQKVVSLVGTAFVLERKRGSVPGKSPLLCFLGEGNADKDWLAYPFPGFLRQDEVRKPSRSWQQLIYVIYAHVLPQLVCTFARGAVLSGWAILTMRVPPS